MKKNRLLQKEFTISQKKLQISLKRWKIILKALANSRN